MPICICPECSKPHKIPAKNLGLKGRCTQCRAIFSLVENKPEPSPAPTPEFVPPPPPEPDPEPEFEADTFSLRLPEPPAPPVLPQPSEPKEASDAWMDEIDFSDDQDSTAKSRRSVSRGDVEPLRGRPAMNIIAVVFAVIGGLFIIYGVLMIVASVYLASREKGPQALLIFVAGVFTFVACVFMAVLSIAIAEVIRWFVDVDKRLYEISKNQSR